MFKSWGSFLKITILVAVFLFPPTYYFVNRTIEKASKDSESRKFENTRYLIEHAKSLFINNLDLNGCAYLKKQREQRNLFAYSYSGPGAECQEPEELDFDKLVTEKNELIYTAEFGGAKISYANYPVAEGELKIVQSQVQASFWTMLTDFKNDFAKSLLIEFAIVLWIALSLWALWVFRNISQIRSFYQNKAEPLWIKIINRIAKALNFVEAEDIIKIHKTSVERVQKLERERAYHAETLEYAVLSEIRGKSFENAFFSFEGTVARIDINNYSSLIYDGNREHIFAMKRTFDWLAAECAYRYHGLFESRAGDEVVYCFRGEETQKRAVAFIRDFMTEFSALRFDFHHKKSTQLFVKASIATSKIQMEASPSKFDFDGDALYFTNRMFGELPYKEKNILIIFPDDFLKIDNLVEAPFETKEITNKEAKLTVSYVDKFLDFSQAYRKDKSVVSLFLGDTALIQAIDFLISEENTLPTKEEVARQLLYKLRSKRPSKTIGRYWLDRLAVFQKQTEGEGVQKIESLFSIFVSLGAFVVSPSAKEPDWGKHLLDMVKTSSPRSQANAVEVLVAWKEMKLALSFGQELLRQNLANFRLQANLYIAEAVHNLSDGVIHRVIQMITSEDAGQSSSGIFAAISIIQHYQEQDMPKLVSHSSYSDLMRELEKRKPMPSDRLQNLYTRIESYAP
ncbi:MAG: hypothetical protein ACLGGX_10975 [Bdellovibrionia bacterium]